MIIEKWMEEGEFELENAFETLSEKKGLKWFGPPLKTRPLFPDCPPHWQAAIDEFQNKYGWNEIDAKERSKIEALLEEDEEVEETDPTWLISCHEAKNACPNFLRALGGCDSSASFLSAVRKEIKKIRRTRRIDEGVVDLISDLRPNTSSKEIAVVARSVLHVANHVGDIELKGFFVQFGYALVGWALSKPDREIECKWCPKIAKSGSLYCSDHTISRQDRSKHRRKGRENREYERRVAPLIAVKYMNVRRQREFVDLRGEVRGVYVLREGEPPVTRIGYETELAIEGNLWPHLYDYLVVSPVTMRWLARLHSQLPHVAKKLGDDFPDLVMLEDYSGIAMRLFRLDPYSSEREMYHWILKLLNIEAWLIATDRVRASRKPGRPGAPPELVKKAEDIFESGEETTQQTADDLGIEYSLLRVWKCRYFKKYPKTSKQQKG